ncbi:hypothetical protein CH063_06466 [Colletotrichum higginsianum]|uniref:Uncharacterized protein n=1 Tax=Colletotrichum higginsianum (strain IMI 349063) TaxID=759273 RepID=H1V2N2_COLHI|nr:hypothetical protein CH063_06466 [Colletotrichum higginsianum]
MALGDRFGGKQNEAVGCVGAETEPMGDRLKVSIRDVAVLAPVSAFNHEPEGAASTRCGRGRGCGCGRECGCGCGCGCGSQELGIRRRRSGERGGEGRAGIGMEMRGQERGERD